MRGSKGTRRAVAEATVELRMVLADRVREVILRREAQDHKSLWMLETRSCRTRTSRHWILVSPTM